MPTFQQIDYKLISFIPNTFLAKFCHEFDEEIVRPTTSQAILHTLGAHDGESVERMYSPTGRLRISVSATSANLLDRLAMNTLPEIFGDIRVKCYDWTFLQYSRGQRICSHIDWIDERQCGCRKLAGISSTLRKARSGGEFFVEEFASELSTAEILRQFVDAPGEFGYDYRSSYRERRFTGIPVGSACVYGPLCPHGVDSVVAGETLRVVGFVFELCDEHANERDVT